MSCLSIPPLNADVETNGVNDNENDEFLVFGIDDVVTILKSDFENAYFVTGIFTSAIYTEDCIFEDPTVRFRIFEARKFCGSLSTYLKLPWSPLICIDGGTFYD
ncbi:uncharacterized protein [Pyrus communis]|uniref:uncharacterized protein n=1 Tax=Pyrus communis TaxID=23211 RepID=UPI0035BFBE08